MNLHCLKIILFLLSLYCFKGFGQIEHVTDSAEIAELPEYLERNSVKINIVVDSAVFYKKQKEFDRVKYLIHSYRKILIWKLKIKRKHLRKIRVVKLANYYVISNKTKKNNERSYYMLFFDFETFVFTNYVRGI